MTEVNQQQGVSCDGCFLTNFVGPRYKCLLCYDFDLCHQCYTNKQFRTRPVELLEHVDDHPVVCIMTPKDFETVYADIDTGDSRRVYLLPCPYCRRTGFTFEGLGEHVMKVHPFPPPALIVNCPWCIAGPEFDVNREIDNLARHWEDVHLPRVRANQNRPPGMLQTNPLLENRALARGFQADGVNIQRAGRYRPHLWRRLQYPIFNADRPEEALPTERFLDDPNGEEARDPVTTAMLNSLIMRVNAANGTNIPLFPDPLHGGIVVDPATVYRRFDPYEYVALMHPNPSINTSQNTLINNMTTTPGLNAIMRSMHTNHNITTNATVNANTPHYEFVVDPHGTGAETNNSVVNVARITGFDSIAAPRAMHAWDFGSYKWTQRFCKKVVRLAALPQTTPPKYNFDVETCRYVLHKHARDFIRVVEQVKVRNVQYFHGQFMLAFHVKMWQAERTALEDYLLHFMNADIRDVLMACSTQEEWMRFLSIAHEQYAADTVGPCDLKDAPGYVSIEFNVEQLLSDSPGGYWSDPRFLHRRNVSTLALTGDASSLTSNGHEGASDHLNSGGSEERNEQALDFSENTGTATDAAGNTTRPSEEQQFLNDDNNDNVLTTYPEVSGSRGLQHEEENAASTLDLTVFNNSLTEISATEIEDDATENAMPHEATEQLNNIVESPEDGAESTEHGAMQNPIQFRETTPGNTTPESNENVVPTDAAQAPLGGLGLFAHYRQLLGEREPELLEYVDRVRAERNAIPLPELTAEQKREIRKLQRPPLILPKNLPPRTTVIPSRTPKFDKVLEQRKIRFTAFLEARS